MPDAREAKCPVCGKPVPAGARTFCSSRCRDIDLGRWLTGGYAIPGSAVDEETPPGTPDPES